jgi:hypothetical protein
LTHPHWQTISTQLMAADGKIRCPVKGWLPVNSAHDAVEPW